MFSNSSQAAPETHPVPRIFTRVLMLKTSAKNSPLVGAAMRTSVLAMMAFGLAGCAASARDEYNYVRGMKVAPSAPETSTASVTGREISHAGEMPSVAESDFRVRRWAQAVRPGSLSDADFEPR